MATLTVTLSLQSPDATADKLALAVSDVLTVSQPLSSVSRANVLHTTQTNVLTSAGNTLDAYVYLRNLDATNFVEVKTDAAAVLIKLAAGEFAFFPVKGTVGLEIQADTATCIVEYGYWTKN